MEGSDVLSFIRKPDVKSSKSVYDRLYFDFSKRTTETRLNHPNMIKSPPAILSDKKIEDVLMLRQSASKSKLKVLRARYQAEEMKEVKSGPEINPNSRIIAEKTSKPREIKTEYINHILANSRFAKAVKYKSASIVKTALIKLDDIDEESSINFLKTSKNSLVSEDKNRYLESLRNAFLQRKNPDQPEEPPSILKMDVVDRGKYWISKRKKNIEKIKNEAELKDLEKCTFAPVLSPRVQTSRNSSRSQSVNSSYSQIFLRKQQNKLNTSRASARSPQARFTNTHSKKTLNSSSLNYSQISPTRSKISYAAGFDIKKFQTNSRPMVRYNSTNSLIVKRGKN